MQRNLPARKMLWLIVLGLGLTVAAGVGLYKVGDRQGMFESSFEAFIELPDAAGIDPGTPVRVRGLEAGRVSAVDWAEDGVRVRLTMFGRYHDKLSADAKAKFVAKMLGTNYIAIDPGTPARGPLADPMVIPCSMPLDLEKVAADLSEVATSAKRVMGEAESGLREIREGKGTVAKLISDPEMYDDLRATVKDTREFVRKANSTLETVEREAQGVKTLVRSGNDAATALKQDAEAIKAMPIIRGYVEDPVAKLVRPGSKSERRYFSSPDLFEPDTAILHNDGRRHLDAAAAFFSENKQSNSDMVVAAFVDPKAEGQNADAARRLTERQAEVVAEYLKDRGAHKLGWWSRRKVTTHGFGLAASPVIGKGEILPATRVEILLFLPQ